MFWLKAAALSNVFSSDVKLVVFQPLMFPLNTALSLNMLFIDVTLDVVQLLMFLLKVFLLSENKW